MSKIMKYTILSLGILLVSLSANAQQDATSQIQIPFACRTAVERDAAGYPESMKDADGLYQFVVVHSVLGADQMSPEELRTFAQNVNQATARIGPERIRWEHGYVGDDFIVGLYRAKGMANICEFVAEGNFSIFEMTPVNTLISPKTADGLDVDLDNRPSIPDGLQQYVIFRFAPGVGKMSSDELKAAAQTSNDILAGIGSEKIRWDYSYVGDDSFVCVYWSDSVVHVCTHADMLRDLVVAEMIIPVSTIISPETAKEP